MEPGKRDSRELVVAGEFDQEVEVDVATKMREKEYAIIAFMETYFDNYVRLGDTDLAGLCDVFQDAQSDGSGPGPSSLPGDGNGPVHN